MKNFVKRIGFFALALLLVCQLVFVAAAAEYVEWEMSDDMTTLTGDGIVYTRYDTFIVFNEDAETVYEYSQNLNYNDFLSSSYVQAPYKGADFVWIYNDYYEPVIYYANEDARASFNRFFDGEGEYRIVEDHYLNATIGENVWAAVRSAQNGTVSRTEDVRNITDVPNYELAVYDKTHTFYYTVGMLFKIDGGYWYTDYDVLGNQQFDANGDFSFRGGEVELFEVDSKTAGELEHAVEDLSHTYTEYEWEDYDPYYEKDEDVELPIMVFWIVYSVIGFVIPLVLAILAAILANSKKLGKPKYLRAVTVASALWILCAAVLAIVLVL